LAQKYLGIQLFNIIRGDQIGKEEFAFNPKYLNALNDLKDKIYKWLQDNDKLAKETKIKNKGIGF